MHVKFVAKIFSSDCWVGTGSGWNFFLYGQYRIGRVRDGIFFGWTGQDGMVTIFFAGVGKVGSTSKWELLRLGTSQWEHWFWIAIFIKIIFVGIFFTFSVQFAHIFDSLPFRSTFPAFALLHYCTRFKPKKGIQSRNDEPMQYWWK